MISRKEKKAVSRQLSLRPAEEGDCELLWRWRNEENTRKWSFNSAHIPYEEHKKWFFNRLRDSNTNMLIILGPNKTEVGQVRFDMYGDGSVEVNISIDIGERGKGYGSAALRLATQYATERFSIAKVIAHIKKGNKESISAFKKAGFLNMGAREFKGHKAIEMIWEHQP